MKKLLVLVLLVTMLFPTIGVAEIDFANMTDEQLLLLNSELATELFSREKTAFVPMGWYVIGKDLPEGEYLLTLDSPEVVVCFVYESQEVYENGKKYTSSLFGEYITEHSKVENIFLLKNGNILTINDPPGVFMTKVSRVIEFK